MSDRLFVHRNGKRTLVGVGFNWWCFFFGSLYGLATGQWFLVTAHLALHAMFFLIMLVGCPPALLLLMGLGANLVVAFRCNGWRVETLLEQGYEET